MIVNESIENGIVVIKLKGKMMGGGETDACRKRVKEYVTKGNPNIVADFSSVEWINSMGMGMLVACYTSCKNAGGELKIGGYSHKTKNLLEMMKLTNVLQIFETKEQAIKSY